MRQQRPIPRREITSEGVVINQQIGIMGSIGQVINHGNANRWPGGTHLLMPERRQPVVINDNPIGSPVPLCFDELLAKIRIFRFRARKPRPIGWINRSLIVRWQQQE
jgi:hypothetical protein